jgi:hypothetical protein
MKFNPGHRSLIKRRAASLGSLVLALLAFTATPTHTWAQDAGVQRAQATQASNWRNRSATQRKYVNSLDDFLDHVLSHIARTVELGTELKRLHPELYSDVDRDLLHAFLGRHDYAKVEVDPKTGRRPFLEGLYKQYGRDFDSFSENEKKLVLRYKDMLNERDAKHGEDFFKAFNKNNRFIDKKGNYTALAKKFLQIESIADKVDRGLSPVSAEEFNREKMALASVFMKDPKEKRLAESLEKSYIRGVPSPYERVTKGHTYEEFRERHARGSSLAHSCLVNRLIENANLNRQILYNPPPLRH